MKGIPTRPALAALLLTICGAATHASAAAFLTVTPGTSPANGYLPLSLFNIEPAPITTNDGSQAYAVSNFAYAGDTWNRLTVSANGYLLVGTDIDSGGPVNQALPNPSGANNVLAPYWTDLDPSRGGAIRVGTLTDGTGTWIVVDWDNVYEADPASTNRQSFQAWIGISGAEDITYAYGAIQGTANPRPLTVGAEDKTGIYGGSYYYNGTGTLPTAGTQLRVRSVGLAVPEPAALATATLGVAAIGRRRRRA